MIKYSLRCHDGHRFESWFADADAYDALARAGHLSCAVCGASQVRKSVMAPRLGTGIGTDIGPGDESGAAAGKGAAPAQPQAAPERPLTGNCNPQETAIAALRHKVERESEYVGGEFARVARAIHAGEEPGRSVHGEARLKDARALIEDGVPILPLPFAAPRKTN